MVVFVIPSVVEQSRCEPKRYFGGSFDFGSPLRMTKSQRISTSDIIASCTRRRSASNSSGVLVCLTRSGRLISTRTLENGCGMIKRSQLPKRQQREYSRFIGNSDAPDFCARKTN